MSRDDDMAPSDHRRRRRWLIVSAVASALLLVGGASTVEILRHLDKHYGPIQQGSFGGLYSERGFVIGRDGFSVSLAETPGDTGELIASVDNLGSHSVQVTSVDTDDIVTRVLWSSYQQPGDGGNVIGKNTRWQEFPATIPANGTIRLLFTIHHPDICSRYPAGAKLEYTGMHTVHWESLLHDHTTVIDDRLEDDPITVC